MSASEENARFIRSSVLKMTHYGKSSHVGSCLSCADILAVLFTSEFSFNDDLKTSGDAFILSKGHAGAAYYSALAAVGKFDKSLLMNHYQNGSLLSGHVSHKASKFIHVSTGSLGHGLPIACGIAHGFLLNGRLDKVYALLSDGELDEGSNWEALLYAAHFNLNNLTVLVDYNKIQSLASTEETIALEPLARKFESFNLNCIEVNGHSHPELIKALKQESTRPKIIICHTTKGKGISFMENNVLWHYRSPDVEELNNALKEL